jgi:hypothetical protein
MQVNAYREYIYVYAVRGNVMDGRCDQCSLPFENSNEYIELTIDTTHFTHSLEYCCLQCVQTWVGRHIRSEEE